MFFVGDRSLRWAKKAAHTAASLQGTVNRVMADTEIVMLVLNNERLG